MLIRSLIGALLALVALAPIALGARALRRRWMPALSGPPATLADIVLGLSLVLVISELLGTVGAFKLVPLTVVLGGVGMAGWRLGRGASPDGSFVPAIPVRAPAPWWRWAAMVSVAVVGAEWMARVVDSWNRGMSTADTLWYHLPIAARYAQDGWTSRLVYVDARSLIDFYPSTSELFHAIGMVFLGNDTLSLVLNVGFVTLALLAAWCIGHRFGVQHLTLVGAAMVLATPQLMLDDAGSGLNDVVAVAFFLSAIALVTHAIREEAEGSERRAELFCGALAAGLAAGTKYTLVLPVVVLAIGVIALGPKGGRIRLGAGWIGAVGITGSYWYLRNLAAVGSPVPSAKIGLGPLHLPSIPFPGTSTFAHFMLNGRAWSKYFVPGLRGAFGPAWWALAAAAGIGIVLGAVASGNSAARLLSFVGFGCLVAYVVSPQILGNRLPNLFEPNARYVAPVLVLGALTLPVALRRSSTRLLSALLAGYLVLLAASQFAATVWRRQGSGYAPASVGRMPVVVGIAIGGAVLLAAAVWDTAARARPRFSVRPRAFVVTAAVVVLTLVAAGLFTELYSLDHRYRNTLPLAATYRWAQDVHDTRIAIVGFSLQYPLNGKDLSNHVQYLAVRHDNGESSPIADCRSWRRAVNAGRYRYVITASPGFPFPNRRRSLEAAWTRSDPAAHLLIRDSFFGAAAWTFELRGDLDPNGCARPS